MLDKIVTAMDGIYDQMAKLKTADTRGDVYEYLLSKIATAGVNGQFRTPRHIIRMMVDLMEPKADEIVCDIKTPTLIQFNNSTAANLQAG
jgi:type I restriction enzyme M protein